MNPSKHRIITNFFCVSKRVGADTRGSILIEFAITLPVLLFLFFVGFEFISFQLARIKVDKAAFLIANAVSQLQTTENKTPSGEPFLTINDVDLRALLEQSDSLLPNSSRTRAKVLVSSFTMIERLNDTVNSPARIVDAPLLLWARGWKSGAINLEALSTIPILGDATEFSKNIQLSPITFRDDNTRLALSRYGNFACGENVVLVEVFYEYQPQFTLFSNTNLLSRQLLNSRAFMRPRLGDIEALSGNAQFSTPADSYEITKFRDGFCR